METCRLGVGDWRGLLANHDGYPKIWAAQLTFPRRQVVGYSPEHLFFFGGPVFSPNSLLLGVLNALKNGRLGAGWPGRVPGRLVSHFLSFVSQFFSFVSQFLSFVFHTGACGVPGWLVSSHFFSLSPRLGACGRVPGQLVSHFLSFVSHFFSFVSQAGCFWSSPASFHLSPRLGACSRVSGRFFPKQFTVIGVLNSFLRRVRPLCHCWCPPISTGHVTFLFFRLPGLSLLVSALFRWPCSISIRVSPRSVTGGVRPFPLVV